MIVTSIRYLTENIKNYKSLVKSGEIIVAEDEETSIVLVRTDKIKSIAEENKNKSNTNYKSNYIGKRIRLYPADTYTKYGIIQNIDEYGWTIKITESRCPSFEAGKEYFISHSKNFTFAFEE